MKNIFPITYWYGVPREYMFKDGGESMEPNEFRLEEIKESGCNLITGGYGAERNKIILKLCEKYGLRMTVEDHRSYMAASDPSRMEELITGMVEDYKDYPALFSYHIVDEPNSASFGILRDIVALIKKLDPEHEAYINLFPNYASAEQLGNPSYRDHVAEYLDVVKPDFLSYDHYHFLCTDPPKDMNIEFASERDAMIYYDAQKKTDRGGFFDNLEIIRAEALRADIPFMLIVLLVKHGPYRYLSESELRFEVYQALAYGATRMSYFTYWTPGPDPVWNWSHGMISADGDRMPHYYNVVNINRELKICGMLTASANSEAVYHIGEERENVTVFAPHKDSVIDTAEGGRFTLGCFDNGIRLIANKDFENRAELKFTSCGKAIEKLDKLTGEWHNLASDNGVYSVTVGAGDGEYIRKLKA